MSGRVCLACRSVVPGKGPCPGGRGHGVVALGAPGERARLVDEIWGPDSRARAMRKAARAGAGGAGIGTIFDGCSGCDGVDIGSGEGAAIVLVIVVAAFAGIALYFLITWLVRLVREWMDVPKPQGAMLRAPVPKAAVAGTGVVLEGANVPLPWKEGFASAFAFELHAKKVLGGSAMLRDAATAGFDVQLEDGRVVHVPAGRLLVRGKLAREKVDEDRLETFLRELDPERTVSRGESDADVFPYDHARGITIRPGDRVDVLGELAPSAEASGLGPRASGERGGAYRAGGVLVPVGVPVIRVRSVGDGTGAPARVRVDDGAGAEVEEQEDEPASREGRAG